MKYKVIVFDFDGTIVDSKQAKIDAYYKAFSSFIEDIGVIDEVLSFYPELNRFDTIQKIIDLSDEIIEYNSVLNKYNKYALEAVKNAKFLESAEDMLVLLEKMNIEKYLSSNTPVEVLKEIIKHKKLNKYFLDISGYPTEKTEYLKNLILTKNYRADEYLVIGDGESDRKSAIMNGTDFYKVQGQSLQKLYLNFVN
jgi:phosphoglycolate phosphatase